MLGALINFLRIYGQSFTYISFFVVMLNVGTPYASVDLDFNQKHSISCHQKFMKAMQPLDEFYDLETLPAQGTAERIGLLTRLDKALHTLEHSFYQWTCHLVYVNDFGVTYKKHGLNYCMFKSIQHLAADFVILFVRHGYQSQDYCRFKKHEAVTKKESLLLSVANMIVDDHDAPKNSEEYKELCNIMAILIDCLPNYEWYKEIFRQSESLQKIMIGTDSALSDLRALVKIRISMWTCIQEEQFFEYKKNYQDKFFALYGVNSPYKPENNTFCVIS